MDDATVRRLQAIFDEMDAGSSPLTGQDVADALKMALFPVDAPSVTPDPFVTMAEERAHEAGHQMAVTSWDVFATTLEERRKKKQEG